MDKRYFSEKLVEWYDQHKRDLPWRNTTDPYKIWLSEIILQQTRVRQGLPYYLNFIKRFKTVTALANAAEEEVLRLWQGLGYYSRARNLHKCARIVVARHGGTFPSSFSELITLPGIGEYTAAAIASFSAREKVAVVDGNVFRVLSRIYGESVPINSPEGKKVFTARATALISDEFPDVFNQAIMEFGAMWCTPRQPACDKCMFAEKCVAAIQGIQSMLPIKLKKEKSRRRFFNYFVVRKGNSLLMKKRESRDIWNGLYDFYLVETSKSTAPEKLIEADSFLKKIVSGSIEASSDYKHVLTHQTIISRFLLVDGKGFPDVRESALKYIPVKKINDLPKPALINRFLEDYNFL